MPAFCQKSLLTRESPHILSLSNAKNEQGGKFHRPLHISKQFTCSYIQKWREERRHNSVDIVLTYVHQYLKWITSKRGLKDLTWSSTGEQAFCRSLLTEEKVDFNCHGQILCTTIRLAQVLTQFISRSLDAWAVAPKACSIVIHFRTFHAANISQQIKPRV